MTERERLILNGKKIEPLTQDESAIATAIGNAGGGGGGSDLPEPGTAGNVLTSNGTAWGSAAPPDNDFIVYADLDVSTMTLSNPSESFADIIAAAGLDKNVRLVATDSTAGVTFEADLSVAADVAIFGGVSFFDNRWYSFNVMMYSNNGLIMFVSEFLPDVTTDDNGKTLVVSSGAWALVSTADIQNAPLVLTGTTSGSLPSLTVTLTEEIADIYAAVSNKKPVYVDLDMGGGNTARMELINFQYANSKYDLTFAVAVIVNGDPVMYSLHFDNSQSASLEFITLAAAT